MKDVAAWRSKLPLDVRLSLKDCPHNPVAEFLSAPRELRRNALMTIQREMKQAPADVKGNIRILGDLMFDYRRLEAVMAHRFSPSEAEAWHEGVSASSSRLINLLSDPNAVLEGLPQAVRAADLFLSELRTVRASADGQIASLHQLRTRGILPDSKPPDFATKRLINNLAHWFEQVTRAKVSRSRNNYHHNPNSPKHGKPSGSFFKVVAAVVHLIRPEIGEEALVSAIRRRNRLGAFQPSIPDQSPRTKRKPSKGRQTAIGHTR